MLKVEKIDTDTKSQVERFVQFHYTLYKGCPQWVPPFRSDIKMMMNRHKHPFYEHSDADFFVVSREGEAVGRIAVMENKPYNQYHGTKQAVFYLFDTIDDFEVAQTLFDCADEWAKARGLNRLVGPKGFGAFDGYGIQVEGFEHRQMMTMMNYNYAYYPKLLEQLGFEREVDFVSCYLGRDKFALPEKVHEIARRVLERGSFRVQRFKNKREMLPWADRIGVAYNNTFVNNWEYYPLSKNEVKFLMDNLMVVLNPNLVKIIMHDDQIVGFLLAFPDISAALQRHDGRITPWGIVDMLIEMKRTKWVSLNGVGVLPQYHGRGGNALLYHEMEKTIRDFGYEHAEQTQMADTAVQVRKDMISVGAEIYKTHRVFRRDIG
ncbi:MAG: hypothetical protein VB089_19665 [Anaerolineaceae bacterium]|jgi:GNAT superfamily N-acetyltransferase|nr:hypothetical protein [Anaerolineaceae bacterium]